VTPDALRLDAERHSAHNEALIPRECQDRCGARLDPQTAVEYAGQWFTPECAAWFHATEEQAQAIAQRDADEGAEVLGHYEIARLSKEREP
jgi:hypothetical protein